MNIIVYVEGPSDSLAMQALLAGLLQRLETAGASVHFIPVWGKSPLMVQTPAKAANILSNDPDAVVIALPDLYPPNIGYPHTSAESLRNILHEKLAQALQQKHIGDTRLLDRFRVFCFKHDLEALVLAAEEQLASQLGLTHLEHTWIVPVENQNMDRPPKRVVEELFRQHGHNYVDTIDARLILGAASYQDIAVACPQCFKPFVDYLEALMAIKTSQGSF